MLLEGLFKGKSVGLASDKDGNLGVAVSHGLHGAAVMAGNVYSAATAVTGVAPGTALGTAGAHTMANPLGSAVYGVIMQGAMGYISGTLGAGNVVWAATANPQLALPTGTAITTLNMLVGGRRAVGQLQAFTTSTITAPVAIRPAFNLDASLASTAGVGSLPVVDYVNGAIVIAPGASVTLHGIAAAGTSPVVAFGTVWEEVAV